MMPTDAVRRIATNELTPAEIESIRRLVWAAFGGDAAYADEPFTEDDWDHALGGAHFILEHDGEIMSHAAVVERSIRVGDRPFRTGYVEAVATAVGHQGRGFGTRLMSEATTWIRDHFELGTLGASRHAFYGRLGWRIWQGQAFVDGPGGLVRTPADEGYILVLETPATPPLDPLAPIVCDPRPGDAW